MNNFLLRNNLLNYLLTKRIHFISKIITSMNKIYPNEWNVLRKQNGMSCQNLDNCINEYIWCSTNLKDWDNKLIWFIV